MTQKDLHFVYLFRFVYIGTLPVVIIYLAAYFILIKVPPNLTDSKDAQNSDETKPFQSNDINNYLSYFSFSSQQYKLLRVLIVQVIPSLLRVQLKECGDV